MILNQVIKVLFKVFYNKNLLVTSSDKVPFVADRRMEIKNGLNRNM